MSTEEHRNAFHCRPAHFMSMCTGDMWVGVLVTVFQLRYPGHVERGIARPIFFRQVNAFQTRAFQAVLLAQDGFYYS